MNSFEAYTNFVGLDHRRRFAQFFTPPPIAKFMVNWVLAGKGAKDIHDPAFGLGAFFAVSPADSKFTGTDIDPAIIDFFRSHSFQRPIDLSCADYLQNFGSHHANIVCNPPYLRFQKFLNRDVVSRAFMDHLGVRLSGYTNIASAFLVKSISELKPDGRLAYILPSEFMNAGYGTMVKDWLMRNGHLDSVIEVVCEREAFDEVTTSVCIVLYDSARKNNFVAFRKVASIAELGDVMERSPVNLIPVSHLDATEKWGRFFVSANERITPARHLLQNLLEYGHFSRGIATGANEFFVLSKSEISRNRIPYKDCRPCITKSQQLTGRVFTDEDFSRLSETDAPVYLFSPGDSPDDEALRYIRKGEEMGYNNRFITRHRKPWYKTEARQISPLLLNVFSRSGYKVVRNYSSALTLTNFHCFYPNPLRTNYIDWLFLFLQSNIGRKILSLSKRKYGNLLDKFEPNDLNRALVPRRAFFDSLGDIALSELMTSVKLGESVETRLDAMFAPLLSEGDANQYVEYNSSDKPFTYQSHRIEQLRLAIENRKKYKGAKSGKTVAGRSATSMAKTKTTAAKRSKSIKARYAK